ncbi:MAG: 4-hydroxythreonine-4-phosphate dehydrogenase PdxA [Planctomycetaceae bacterium]|nr:4-hydroxythreonine-4-phosphate dehydrogenase PdxA [Planctomycetaceae bacterium]
MTNGERKPLLALTLGDPAGIGPEIVAAACAAPEVHRWCRPVVVGHPEMVRRAIALRQTSATVRVIGEVEQADPSPAQVACLATGSDEVLDAPAGEIDGRSGQAAYEAIVAAAELALAGRIDGLVTAPLHKQALHEAGHHYPGHTELLAEMCGVDDFAMMLYLGPEEPIRGPAGLAVVHVTLHTAMRNVFEEMTSAEVLAKAHLAHAFMLRMKGEAPKIGVCALNPHGGEGGLFGREELDVIRPAIEAGLAEGLDLEGPLPADTVMIRARNGEFDAVVAMYHDQGHIALKLLGMHRAVNVTLGLPIVRTSVAHGTAFDLAWKGRAEVGSMIEAIRVAVRLCDGCQGSEFGVQGLIS